MTARYYVPQLDAHGGLIELSDSEAHHAVAVMRVRAGQAVTLFDGRGHEAAAQVISASKRRVQCQASPPQFLPRANQRSITIGLSLPKGDRARDLIERLTELGVDRIVPLHCQHSPWKLSPNALEKLRRVVVEACKQCQRNRLMEIDAPRPFADFIQADGVFASQSTGNAAPVRLLAHPGGAAAAVAVAAAAAGYQFAIGPEGGFDNDEIALARAAGWACVGLGERILRIETAAISLAVLAAAKVD